MQLFYNWKTQKIFDNILESLTIFDNAVYNIAVNSLDLKVF